MNSNSNCAVVKLQSHSPASAVVHLQGGIVTNHDQQFVSDVLIEDGLIKQIARKIKVCHAIASWLSDRM